jgi:hypothetical protein
MTFSDRARKGIFPGREDDALRQPDFAAALGKPAEYGLHLANIGRRTGAKCDQIYSHEPGFSRSVDVRTREAASKNRAGKHHAGRKK